MAQNAPITNLQGVSAWLSTLSTGQQVTLTSSMFQAAMVNQMFGLVPGLDGVQLTVTAIDIPTTTLTGTGTILGDSNATQVFTFSQPGADLLSGFTVTPATPPQWQLLDQFKVIFEITSAALVPNADVSSLALTLNAAMLAGSNPVVTVPISLTVPSFDGDWLLTMGDTKVGQLTDEALKALAGGADLMSILPKELIDIKKFSLTGLEIAFNPKAQTCSLIRLGVEYAGDWQFFDNNFTVRSLNFEFEVFTPFTKDKYYAARLFATMQLGQLAPFEVGGQFPEKAVFCQLAPDSTLYIVDLFQFFRVDLPQGFPNIGVTQFSFTFYTADDTFFFLIAIGKPFPLWGSATLDNFQFDIGTRRTNGQYQGYGDLTAHFTIAKTTILITGKYAQGEGLYLLGKAEKIPIGELIKDLAAKFGVDNVPDPIGQLSLDLLQVEIKTDTVAKTDSFKFTCTGTTTVAGLDVSFTPVIEALYDETAKKFTGKFSGTLVLHDQVKKRDLKFSVVFSKEATDTWIEASFDETGGALNLQDFADLFGWQLPPVPPDLDLGLQGARLYYDFTTGTFAIGADSVNYGKAIFLTMVLSGKREYFFLLASGKTFSLSNLPLVGETLEKIEDISIGKLMVAISSLNKVDADTAKQINQPIKDHFSGYPQIPDTGLNGTALISGELDFGTEKLPLSVTLGGGSSNTLEQAPNFGLLPAASGDDNGGGQVVPSTTPDGTNWFSIQKSFGPVSIQRIGVLYQSDNQTLWFQIDATLQFGPLTLGLVGLGIGSPLTTFSPKFNLQGLGVAYKNPPLEIAGALVNLAPPGASYIEFEGGVTISTGTFTVQAFGYYGNKNGFSSMFLFGDIGYPFGGPPAFFVTGIALGFGYNSSLRIPTIDEVQKFPFIQVLPGSTSPNPDIFGKNPTPLSVLQVIRNTNPPWVAPLAGSLWFGAGITFTSFELVNSQALVLVDAGPQLVIALVGTSRAQFPQAVPDVPDEPVYANIELDLLVRFAPTEGVFSLQAVLASSSFVLTKACVLTGGFAFFVWFGNNPHAGDFVLSLGGYNPGFTPPKYYPSVPRVGFHWSVDSSITIQGGAYFALTPSALMLGGMLSATYQSGNLKAWFDAHCDAIVRWKPFWFDVDIGITVGASYRLDLGFTTATLKVELGCDLEFWGPPTGGTVTVEWYIISFTIPFGESKDAAPQIHDWSAVQALLPNAGTEKDPNLVSIAPVEGLTPSGTAPQGSKTTLATATDSADIWMVRASQFAFSTSCSIPATTATVGDTYKFDGTEFNVYPLRWDKVSASHVVTVADPQGKDVTSAFEADGDRKDLPASLWGSPPESKSGQPQVPKGTDQLVKNQITGVTVRIKPPTVGNTAGSIDVARNLATDNLKLPDAVVPITPNAPPAGDIAVNDPSTIEAIADPNTGIASTAVTTARNDAFAALALLHYQPPSRNDPMTRFASQIGCSLVAEPLMVPAGGSQ